jgi:hypothetical protein
MSQQTSNGYTQLGNYQEYVTSELRALTMRTYHDPLVLSFKVIFDYSKEYGLLSDETNVDSALAYLKRIGETARYTMLKQWISIWKTFWSQYDFLIQQVDGLAVVENWKPQDNFNESEKVVFQIRETADMMFTGLMATYRQIWHDDIRVVEVLPANLRRFDMTILVYNSSYYNPLIYDIPYGSTINTENIPIEQIEQVVFPTARKLSDQQFSLDTTAQQFNHMMYKFGDVNINTDETGSQFASSIQNEQSGTPLMQNLSLNFRFANYSGRFNNTMGNVNFATLLSMMSAQNRASSLSTATQAANNSLLSKLETSVIQQGKAAITDTVNIVKNTLLTKNVFIGNIINSFTAETAQSLTSQLFGLGITYAQNALVVNPLAKLNNILMNNFSSLINSLEGRTNGPGIGLVANNRVDDLPVGVPYVPIINGPAAKNPTLGEYNVFTRRGF